MKSLIKLTFQNSDIVVILESGDLTMDMSLETRFCYQAPIIKQYADAIAKECPNSFIIVCASPIDCMVPLIAEVSLFIVYNSIISLGIAVTLAFSYINSPSDLYEAH